jgi:hypothetical protein
MTETLHAPEQVSAEQPQNDRKKLFIGGGLVGALVLGAGGYFLLGSGGGSTDAADTSAVVKHVVKHVEKPATPVASVKAGTKAATKPVTLPPTSTVALGRDPFKPLYVAPAAPGAGTTGTTGAPGTTPTTPSTGGATGTATTGTAPAATTPYLLQLQSVDSSNTQLRKYTFVVAGLNRAVVQSQKFGKYGELVVLAVTTNGAGKVTGALVQVGDANPFSMKLGEKATVA